jgi:hypothetical protein
MKRTKNTESPTRAALAEGLGLSERQVYRMAKLGMPTDSLEAALAWRAECILPRVDEIAEDDEDESDDDTVLAAFDAALRIMGPALSEKVALGAIKAFGDTLRKGGMDDESIAVFGVGFAASAGWL